MRSFGTGPGAPGDPRSRRRSGARLEDGMRMGDLSSQSGDHGVNVNPAARERAGGGSWPGDAAVWRERHRRARERGDQRDSVGTGQGRVRRDYVRRRVHAARVAAVRGTSRWATAPSRCTWRRAAGVRANYETPEGEIPNSFNRAAARRRWALSYTKRQRLLRCVVMAGIAPATGSHCVEEGEDESESPAACLQRPWRAAQPTGPFESFRGSFAIRRYKHDELDGEEVATAFKNDTGDVDVLANASARRPADAALIGATFWHALVRDGGSRSRCHRPSIRRAERCTSMRSWR